jgi:hypothetical protein
MKQTIAQAGQVGAARMRGCASELAGPAAWGAGLAVVALVGLVCWKNGRS